MHSIRFSIADINLLLSSPIPISLQDHHQAYKEFLNREDKADEERTVHIHIEPTAKKTPVYKNRLFESGGNWSLFLDGEDYLIEFKLPGTDEAAWIAQFKRSCKDVWVFCGSRLLIEKDGKKSVINPFHYPLDQILLMYIFAHREGLLIHATGVEINRKAYIFPGRAGAGKSTISNLLNQRADWKVLSDDRIIVRKNGGVYTVYGTPWPSDARIAHNTIAPLGGIFFIFHGKINRIKEIEKRAAVERLLPVASIPWYDKDIIPGMLDFCEILVSSVPTYELHFRPDAEVADVLEEFLT